ncbi:ATP-binding protein [Niallia taxi]|uniref:Signal transduction histidine-protein kinase ArlS n=1 Tax=Niallia taxi TaxID=2499688 RepID=A0A3S2UU53_9BACI|nr:ATP-binding protein [Niallia taxi]MCM3214387.1 ATP-binding protein [Niallia taxi]MDK8641165.1 ATP-binding protein [Niallia taxi]MED4039897.1 ATP-binding protein [Niallia taxi]MED4052575.1 ATP-binding protein [Niallia taxi]MED4119930.1 ATP-binding protein [Niallia taxi]
MNIVRRLSLLPWKWKLTLGLSLSIFLTYSIFTFFEFHTVSTWLMNQEENDVRQTMNEFVAYLKSDDKTISETEIKNSLATLEQLNTKNQLIRVIDEDGNVLISHLNGDFPILEPDIVKEEKELKYVSVGEEQSLVYSYPIKSKDFSGEIEIIRLLDSYKLVMKHLAFAMMLFAIAAILISALIGYLMSRELLKPLSIMTNTMKKIKSAGFKERMPVYPQKDEISELTTIFNHMMDRIELSFQAQKQFVEDASHELRTPISILEGHLSMLNRWGKHNPEILEESLKASLDETEKLKKLVLTLLDLTRLDHNRIDQDNLSPEKVNTIIEGAVKDFQMLHSDFKFQVQLQSSQLNGIAEQHFQQVLTILLDNAIKYSGASKEISISTSKRDKLFILQISDKGIGIPDEEIDKVFDRFYRVDKARSRGQGGTGLGLAIAKKIVDYYQGSIQLDSRIGEGTTVTISLPENGTVTK